MTTLPTLKTQGYAYFEPKGPFHKIDYELVCGPNDALVQVAGCGLCHTDIGYHQGHVAPRGALPLVLGHEIAGTVVEAGEDVQHLMGKNVVVPAVLPCGLCAQCLSGCENTCKRQFMPGNDGHGGFARHIRVPGRDLAVLPDDLGGYALAELAVIADAVTTPFQSLTRAHVKAGDVAIILGAGGIGSYGVQIARALGATVIAIDIDDRKLERAQQVGARFALNSRGLDLKAARAAVKKIADGAGLPDFGWKIFEMSGSAAGQELAFSLIPPSGTLAIVGFTMAKLELRLSNLMALDATCFGNWGCSPKHYAPAIQMVLDGRVTLKPLIRRFSLDDIQQVFEAAHHGELTERAILIPNH